MDPDTGHADEIVIDAPLVGFFDGLSSKNRTPYILIPTDDPDVIPDRVQVVKLGEDLLTGKHQGTITDPDMDGIAGGAIHGKSLYVNNARY